MLHALAGVLASVVLAVDACLTSLGQDVRGLAFAVAYLGLALGFVPGLVLVLLGHKAWLLLGVGCAGSMWLQFLHSM